MTIAEVREKCKALGAKIPRDGWLLGILVLSCLASFSFGYLAGREAGELPVAAAASPVPLSEDEDSGQVVASKSGTKYYFPGCAGAARIAEGNKVWFPSASAAEEVGYSAAANCAPR